MARPVPFASIAVGSILALAGCHMDQRYVSPDAGGAWQLAITPTTPPFFSGEELTVFLVEQRIELPLREPTGEQFAALSTPDARGLGPYPRRPWGERGDYELEIDFTLSNPSTSTQRVTVTIDGFNEFHEYLPGVQVIGDDVVIDFSGWERAYELAPGERRTVTIREEELDEVAVDLATVVNMAPNSNQIVYFENHSAHDARSQQYIPPVIPALTGVRLGLRLEAGEGAEAATSDDCSVDGARCAAIEAVVRLRDPRDRIVAEGEIPWTLPIPAPFVPVVPEEE